VCPNTQVRKAGGWWMSMRGWHWNGKGGEGGNMVMRVGFGAGVGGGHVCQNMWCLMHWHWTGKERVGIR